VAVKNGRPTKYTPDLVAKAHGYLRLCIDRYDVVEIGRTGGQLVWDVKLPSIAGLARHIGVSRETIYAWKAEQPGFSDILDDILAEQEQRLINQGLAGNYSSAIAKLVLGKHGYHDKVDQELTGKNGGSIAFIDMAKSDSTDPQD
jgi:hypothetical protein